MNIGEKIQLRCNELGISQRQAALKAGLSVSFVAGVVKGKKGLGIDSAKKLAEALDWPASELLGTDAPTNVERWFWSAAMGTLTTEELATLRDELPARRIAWSLHQVRAKYPDLDLADAIGTTREHIERLLGGDAPVTGQLMASITAALQLPAHWLTLGEPTPTDQLMQAILQHHNAVEWLQLVAKAIERDVPPTAISRLIEAFLQVAEQK